MFTNEIGRIDTPLALALGNFDGLHLGHKRVLDAVCENPYGLTPAIAAFDPHPKALLSGTAPDRLLCAADQAAVLEEWGVRHRICFDFAAVRDWSPAEFLDALCSALPIGMLAAGYNFRFGKGGAGDIDFLKKYCEAHALHFFAADAVRLSGVPVSSTAIRDAVSDGEIERAEAMLGRPLIYTLKVEDGDHRGRTIGFPTINQVLPHGLARPKFGVYAAQALVDGVWRVGITNFGIRPTYRLQRPQLETFILNFSGDLYGQEIPLRLCRFIRPETKFSSLEELKNAIERDIRTALDIPKNTVD